MNRSLLRRLVSEPLLQLLVAGAAIFGGYALLSPSGARASRAIVIDAEFVRSLSRGLARRLGHAPTRAQLERAVERHVEEELYVRGAVALGLARGDAIVRRRLAQKMRFVAEGPEGPPPREAELRAYLAAHPRRFRRPPRVTFRQLLVARDKHAGAVELRAAATRLAARLSGLGASSASGLGDASLLPRHYRRRALDRVGRELGAAIARRLRDAPLERWSGPVASPYGLHFVYLERREPGGAAAFAEVRAEVRAALLAERRAARRARSLERLRARFPVKVHWPHGAPAPAVTASR